MYMFLSPETMLEIAEAFVSCCLRHAGVHFDFFFSLKSTLNVLCCTVSQ